MVSIIVPIYNKEKYLPECIESILAQTYRNIEVILIDDGSKDKSGIICDEYAARDSRIKVLHKPNGGRNAARLDGYKLSHGEWIMFVDADDVLTNNCAESLIKSSDSVDVIFGREIMTDENLQHERFYPKHIIEEFEFDTNQYVRNLIIGKCRVSLCGALFNRKLFTKSKLNIPKEIYYTEDLLISLSLALDGVKFRGIKSVVYKYRVNPANTISNFKITLNYFNVLVSYIEEILRKKTNLDDFSYELFNYKISNLIAYQFDNYKESKIFKDVLRDYKKYKLTNTEKYFIFVSKFKSDKLTSYLWKIYQKIGTVKYKLMK